MCHNSGIESEQQIERYVAYGMPEKAIKSVKYTMRKREKAQLKQQQQLQQQQQQQQLESSSNNSDSDSEADSIEHQLLLVAAAAATATAAAANLSSDIDSTSSSGCASDSEEITCTATTATVALTAAVATAAPTTTTTTPTTTTPTVNNNSNSSILKIPKMCGRFRKLQEAATASQASSEAAERQRKLSSMEPSMDDALAIGTQMTRKFTERIYCLVAQLQASRLYTILTRTTQPAHLIAICILSFVLLTVGPDLMESTPSQSLATATRTAAQTQSADKARGSNLATLAYLGAFATHFGSQIWMTFVSGLSLYFSLPRHTFGQCQQILFPKYFALNAMLSISMLIIYVKYFLSNWTTLASLEMAILVLSAAIEVVVRLYLAPPMLRLMHEKYKIEDAIGSGQEVGNLLQGDLVQCPHYQRIHKAFRRMHMAIAIGNMIVLLATCLQLYFLASKIRIS